MGKYPRVVCFSFSKKIKNDLINVKNMFIRSQGPSTLMMAVSKAVLGNIDHADKL